MKDNSLQIYYIDLNPIYYEYKLKNNPLTSTARPPPPRRKETAGML